MLQCLASYSLENCPPFGDTNNIVENVVSEAAAAEESFERGSHDSGTGTLKKGATLLHAAGSGMALRAKERKLQEELDCERLSREVFLVGDGGGGDHKLQSLFGKRFGYLQMLLVIIFEWAAQLGLHRYLRILLHFKFCTSINR